MSFILFMCCVIFCYQYLLIVVRLRQYNTLQDKDVPYREHVYMKLYPWKTRLALAEHLKSTEVYNQGTFCGLIFILFTVLSSTLFFYCATFLFFSIGYSMYCIQLVMSTKGENISTQRKRVAENTV